MLTSIKLKVPDASKIKGLLRENKTNAVMHLVGLKAVGESVLTLLIVLLQNIQGTLDLFLVR